MDIRSPLPFRGKDDKGIVEEGSEPFFEIARKEMPHEKSRPF